MREKLVSAIEHIEQAMDLLDDISFAEKGASRYQVYQDACSSLKARRRLLLNELHYLDKNALAKYLAAQQTLAPDAVPASDTAQ